MNIQQAKEEIIRSVYAYTAKEDRGNYRIPASQQRPLLLMGPPGIGKTAIMEQAARECGVGLVSYTITHHTRQSAVGLPQLVRKTFGQMEYTMTEYTMSEIVGSIYEYMEKTGYREGILFIDEINCVSETLAPTMLQFLQYKTFGTHRIPEGWVIVAAGNPPEYNKSVRELDMAVLDRVRQITVEADFDVWKTYARERELHPAILSYLEMKPEYFYRIIQTRTRKEFVTARGWEELSVLLTEYERQKMEADQSFMQEFLKSPQIASDFASYYHLYRDSLGTYRIPELIGGKLTEEEQQKLLKKLGSAPGEVRCMFLAHLLAASSRKLKDYAESVRLWKREKEVRGQLEVYLKEDSQRTLRDFLKQRCHAEQVQKEHGLLKGREEILEQKVDERLRTEPKAQEGPPDQEKEQLHRELDRGIDFLIQAFGKGTELTDYLLGLKGHGDFALAGYDRPEFQELCELRSQELALQKELKNMEETV